jgi:dCTP deaminase
MSMSTMGVSSRITAAYEAITSLQTRLAGIPTADFTSKNPSLLLSVLMELADILQTHLFWRYAEESRRLGEQASPTQADSLRRLTLRVSAILEAVARLTPVIKFVDGARAQINPWGLVSQVEQLSRSLAPNACTIIRPRWEYNYTYYAIDVALNGIINKVQGFDEILAQALGAAVARYPKFFALSFPPTQTDNVLQIATWAHELGHFMDNSEGEKRYQKAGAYLSAELMKDLKIQMTAEERERTVELLAEHRRGDNADPLRDLDELWRRIVLAVAQRVRKWAREIFADVFSIHLFGPAALFGFCDLALFLFPDLDALSDEEHPSLRHRLGLMLDELDRWSAGDDWTRFLPGAEREAVEEELLLLSGQVKTPKPRSSQSPVPRGDTEAAEMRSLLQTIAERAAGEIASVLRDEIDRMKKTATMIPYLEPNDLCNIKGEIELLHRWVPPVSCGTRGHVAPGRRVVQLARVINAGWFYWLAQRRYPEGTPDSTFEMLNSGRRRTNTLLLKAVELTEAREWFEEHRAELCEPTEKSAPPRSPRDRRRLRGLASAKGALSKAEILCRMDQGSLVIAPLIDPEEQIGDASIDVRLGNEFISTTHTKLAALDPTVQQIARQIAEYQTKTYVPFGRAFVLQPQQFVLGSTLEYICLPDDVVGLILGRSSWGRLGLIIATASKVAPASKSVLTLELVNLGSVPIFLYPCSRIAQLVLIRVSDFGG